ncbi:MAG: flavodoxin [Methanosphaera stadtmanae]|jgi:flavodoxin|nr:flavodoxin [Methanosphaera stadtmanae]
MKSLIIYYSRAGQNYVNGDIVDLKRGNNEIIVDYITEFTQADTFRVETVNEYPTDYMQTTEVAQEEQRNNARPELKQELDDISDYDIIYIVAPNWWGTLPMAMFTQLEKLDFTDKIVKTLITHEGSGLGSSMKDVEKLCQGADIKKGLAIHGAEVDSNKSTVEKWIESN